MDVVEFQPDDLEQVVGGIGAEGTHFWWVGVWLEIEDGDRVLEAWRMAVSLMPCWRAER